MVMRNGSRGIHVHFLTVFGIVGLEKESGVVVTIFAAVV